MHLSGGGGSYFSRSSFECCVLNGWAVGVTVIYLDWSGVNLGVSRAPGPQKLNLNRTKGYL